MKDFPSFSFFPIGHFVSSRYVLVTFAINDYDIDILQNLNGVLWKLLFSKITLIQEEFS